MDNIDAYTAPPIGSAQAGDLYVDLQSRTLWLGVDAAVDPAQFVLISDIVALQSQITSGDTAERTYVDAQLLLKAPLANPTFTGDPKAPTPVSTDNDTSIATTAFVKTAIAALGSTSFVTGMIMMYSGSLANIGVGGLAGWHLCDGAAGTPDLRDKFIIGAGNKLVGEVNPLSTVNTALGGQHTHTVNGTALTVAQLPAHSHTGATGNQSVDHQHYVNIDSGTESADHSHATPMYGRSDSGSPVAGSWAQGGSANSYGNQSTSGRNVAHTHNVQGWSGGVSANHTHAIPAEGGGAVHTHTLVNAADHQHALTSTQLRDTLPYYALAYIMKL